MVPRFAVPLRQCLLCGVLCSLSYADLRRAAFTASPTKIHRQDKLDRGREWEAEAKFRGFAPARSPENRPFATVAERS